MAWHELPPQPELFRSGRFSPRTEPHRPYLELVTEPTLLIFLRHGG